MTERFPPFKLVAAAIGIIFVLAFARVTGILRLCRAASCSDLDVESPAAVPLAGLAIAFIGLVLFAQ